MNRSTLTARLRRLEPAGRELARRTLLRRWEADPDADGALWYRTLGVIGAFLPPPREYPRLAERPAPEGEEALCLSGTLPPDVPAPVRAAVEAMEAAWRQEPAAAWDRYAAGGLWAVFDRYRELFAAPDGECRLAAYTAGDLGRPETDRAGLRESGAAQVRETEARVQQRAAAALGITLRELGLRLAAAEAAGREWERREREVREAFEPITFEGAVKEMWANEPRGPIAPPEEAEQARIEFS